MKKKTIFLGLFALMGLSGCETFTTPEGTIRLFAHSLKENDTELYTRALTGDALERCGTLHAMMNIQDELRKFKNANYAEPVLVSSQNDPLNRVLQENYEIAIHGSNPDVPYELNWKFTVECLTTWSSSYDPINHGQVDDIYRRDCRIARMNGPFCGSPQN